LLQIGTTLRAFEDLRDLRLLQIGTTLRAF